ncbi:glycosyltransferase N-terminal domain-containing protein [Acetobacter indonesiensis]|uniref:glycosyltransferase N-terminal domain-containing protein n=1 Tax=Acetobacter indonesiensis TaxID=104101 RepID=UPI0039EA9A3F
MRNILISCIRAYLGFTLRTTRWTITVEPEAQKLLTVQDGHPAIVAFWHEVLPLTPALWWWAEPQNPDLRLNVLISKNRDGRLIADVVSRWRIWSIAGSSDARGKNKGGAAAVRRMRAKLRAGELVAITPDGPRGPRREAQQGAVALAKMVKMPVVPIGAACSGIRLKSWDRMILPLPFGKGKLVCGAPVSALMSADIPIEEAAAQLSDAITKTMDAAENAFSENSNSVRPAQETAFFKPLALKPSRIWAGTASFLAPVLPFFLRWRQTRGKENPARVREKMGFASLARPAGPLIWFHAASVGEVISILPLVEQCQEDNRSVTVLITTGTLTAAQTVAQRLRTPRVLHQFLPLDVPRWGKRFLDHWQPQAAVFTESELWPNLIGLCHRRNLPVMLVNGRMSASSLAGWQRVPRVARRMLERFAWVAPRTQEDAERFALLGARTILPAGDIKTAAAALPVDQAMLNDLRTKLAGRSIFLAASTHEGEEEKIRQTVENLSADYPEILTIIVPRHPERGHAIAQLFPHAAQRSQGQFPTGKDPVWICDTLGELGLFYRLADYVFIGNSLPGVKGGGGGHNPFEPARLHCAISTGPLTQNFTDAFALLGPSVATVTNGNELAAWVKRMHTNTDLKHDAMDHAKTASSVSMQLIVTLAACILHALKT